jgi:predicted ArsR family transcriptional regulator
MPIDPSDVRAVALLDEPVRRALYELIVARGDAVSRDEAAAGVGVSRALAAFHLDRLVRDGLLAPEYRRLTGRTGPGAGRPAKLYRRADREVAVSIPDRRYEAAARLLAQAMEVGGPPVPSDAVRDVAWDTGRSIGADARRAAGPRPDRRRRHEALVDTLRERGYEPRVDAGGAITLGNCPFDALVDDHRDLVCGMNLALADGVLAGLGETGTSARLDPAPGRCCVVLEPVDRRTGRRSTACRAASSR